MLEIILIDDDQMILLGLEKIIKQTYPNKVNIASYLSPEKVLQNPQLIKNCHLILTDISMGKMNGLDFLRAARKINTSFQSIIISAHQNFSYAQQSIDLGVLTYITKPVDFKYLLSHIDGIYSNYEMNKATSPDIPEVVIFLMEYIEENYMKNITLKSIAKEFHYNPSYLGRLFNKHLNKSFNLFLQEKRIQASKKLLRDYSLSIDEVSYLVGFLYSSYFSITFKEFTGLSPLKYRQQELIKAENN